MAFVSKYEAAHIFEYTKSSDLKWAVGVLVKLDCINTLPSTITPLWHSRREDAQ